VALSRRVKSTSSAQQSALQAIQGVPLETDAAHAPIELAVFLQQGHQMIADALEDLHRPHRRQTLETRPHCWAHENSKASPTPNRAHQTSGVGSIQQPHRRSTSNRRAPTAQVL
jgi:hypothetical protein